TSDATPMNTQTPGNEKHLLQMIVRGVCVFIGVASLVAIARLVLAARARGTREAIITRPIASMTLVPAIYVGSSVLISMMIARANMPFVVGLATMILAFLGIGSLVLYPISTFVALYRSYRDSGVEE